MNDYHLDPPDYPDPPSCPVENCEGWGDFARLSPEKTHDILTCDECGHEWSIEHPRDWGDEPEAIDAMHRAYLEEMAEDHEPDPECPHKKPWSECDACDYLSDLAYDAAREGRGR